MIFIVSNINHGSPHNIPCVCMVQEGGGGGGGSGQISIYTLSLTSVTSAATVCCSCGDVPG